ncbi:TetR/AcrR family transcriptional regulator [bacterium BMS3Abin03]|jgi:AcrR family transcriptional regulator|nr:TetR/AcrR family transcriptional regulator [bacterium BMS3Abin03]
MAKDRKEQIILAAVKRFARQGMGKTTLDEIAGDIRIGKATIYHYFESKEQLFYESLRYETESFIEAIKAIFNNTGLAVGERLLDYISFKETIDSHYKLIFNLMIKLMEDNSSEQEIEILTGMLKREEEIIRLVLNSIYSTRIESMNESIPNFIVTSTWGIFFSSRINRVSYPGKIINIKDLVFKSLENLLS